MISLFVDAAGSRPPGGLCNRAQELSAHLADHAEDLVGELLRHGKFGKREVRIGSACGEPGGSTVIWLAGPRRGRWRDYATGDHGDLLDLIAAVEGIPLRDAMRWAREWLGLGYGPAAHAPWVNAPPAPGVASGDDEGERIARALAKWGEAITLAGTLADRYLREVRGVALPIWPPCLRFHRRLFHPIEGRTFPALVALVVDAVGQPSGIHAVYLNPSSGRKAAIKKAKLSFGLIGGGAVRLGGLPAGHLAVAEGLEDALTVMIYRPAVPCWAGLGGARAGVIIPDGIESVDVIADRDDEGEAMARNLGQRLVREGRKVRIVRPPVDFKDFNAAHLAGGL